MSAGKYFNRPQVVECITLSTNGMMACNGEVVEIPAGLVLPKTLDMYDDITEYYVDKEDRLFLCLKFDKCE